MSSSGLQLPPVVERLYLAVQDGQPKKIADLYYTVNGQSGSGLTTREMQQHIGWAVTNLNRRIRKKLKKILKPAEIKGTYALVKLDN